MEHGSAEGTTDEFNESSNRGDGKTGLNEADERNNLSDGLHGGSLEFGRQQAQEIHGSGLRNFDARAEEAVQPKINVVGPRDSIPSDESISVTEVSAGRIPPPEMMAKYERLRPGSFDRFFALVEKEQEAEIRQKDELIAAESLKTKAWANVTNAEAEGRRIKNKEVETKRRQSKWEFILSIVLRIVGFTICVNVLFLRDSASSLKIAVLVVMAGIIIFSLDVFQTMAKSIKSIGSFFKNNF